LKSVKAGRDKILRGIGREGEWKSRRDWGRGIHVQGWLISLSLEPFVYEVQQEQLCLELETISCSQSKRRE